MSRFPEIFNKYSHQKVIEILRPMFSETRLKRMLEVLDYRLESIEVAIESPADIHNALAVMRTCESLGVFQMHIVAPETRQKGKGTMKGANHWTNLHYHKNLESLLKEKKHKTFIGSYVHGSTAISEVPIDKPFVVFFGNENRGLSNHVLEHCEYVYTLPMMGMTESYNVSVSAAISLFELTKRRREYLQTNGDLTSDHKELMLAEWFVRQIGADKTQKILRHLSSGLIEKSDFVRS